LRLGAAGPLRVRVAVRVFETGLVHMLMGVLGSVLVGVGVLVGDMVMLMWGVRRVMGVKLGHG
jgi:hypothetical protein